MDTLEKIMLEEANKVLSKSYSTHEELNENRISEEQAREIFGKVFDRLDINEDSFLTFSDFSTIYKAYGESFTEKDFNEILKKSPEDQNKNERKISRNTFIDVMMKWG